MKKASEIDFNEINELLFYDETSPSGLRWKVSRANNKIKLGDVAGCVHTNYKTERKCWVVTINGKWRLVHRIIFAIQHGSVDPNLDIDHIDGNSMNNTITNLRAIPKVVNQRNQKMCNRNSSGVTGVRYNVGMNHYVANYYDMNGNRHFKCFSCKKLGIDEAFNLAIEWRTNMIKSLNIELGEFGYTDRHGLNCNAMDSK